MLNNIVDSKIKYYWGLCGPNEGIGDFIIKLPAIDFYTLDQNNILYFDCSLNKKFESLLPKRDNLIIEKHNESFNVHREHVTGIEHITSAWLKRDSIKYSGNFSNTKNNFIYPSISINKNLQQKLLKKINLLNTKYITILTVAADPSRNWDKYKWQLLIDSLKDRYKIINIGLKQSEKNSINRSNFNDVINFEEFDINLNLYEIGHIMAAGNAHIGVNSGMFHLATAFNSQNIFVISSSSDKYWVYPSNHFMNKNLDTNEIIKFINQNL